MDPKEQDPEGKEASSGIKAPTSAFSEDECASREDLVKMCFTLSPTPSAQAYSSSISSNGSYTGTVADLSGNLEKSGNINGHHGEGESNNMACVPNLSKGSPTKSDCDATATTASSANTPNPGLSPCSFKRSDSSRQGRDNQRWETCPESGRLIRLVTGSVPITKDGSVIFVSASKKREWILPKGGWELDETLEEGAMRETFEEAGVLGTLGPRLSDVVYETRKGRKRRIAEMKLIDGAQREGTSLGSTGSRSGASSEDEGKGGTSPAFVEANKTAPVENGEEKSASSEKLNASSPPNIGDIKSADSPAPSVGATEGSVGDVGTAPDAVTDGTQEYSQNLQQASLCRMALFPLYVSEVHEEWPESGRTRKAIPIDEAIKTTNRHEIKLVLEEIKRRGLHRPMGADHTDDVETNNDPATNDTIQT